ncbi:hypothetical protein LPTSP3_g18250 [Leptospira kobayashii]|uniref:Uncharacterized protein n=1 Tax=Leptospira kobayashii TaxID=1917830 RepID=A0ABN6KE26_9LEPT|nr:hypothetical protein LPTSP3_g18250 [Leptospira kobayashii]
MGLVYYPVAIRTEQIRSIKQTGAQRILSHLLGVIKFKTTPIEKNPTTIQMIFAEKEFQSGNTIPARVKTIVPMIPKISI